MQIDKIVEQAAAKAVEALWGEAPKAGSVNVSPTRKEFEGNYTVVVFPFTRMSHKSPEETGNAIGQWLVENEPTVSAFNVIKGFLNLTIAAGSLVDSLNAIAANADFGFTKVSDASPLVMVEYSSPNTNKPLHLGHVRNNLLGYSLSKILEANGCKVVKTNIVNDRGIHICKSMLAWKKWGEGVTPQSAGKKGDHLIGDFYVAFDKHYKQEIADLVAGGMSEDEAKEASPLMKEARAMLVAWENGDEEVRKLWSMMNSWVYEGFDDTYKRLGVSFDKIYYESQTYLEGKELVLKGVDEGKMYRRDDGSVWADLSSEGLDEKLLLRSDGTSVYMTQDIGTARLRYEDYPIDKMVYVVGNEQNYHFQVLSILLDRLGFKWGKGLVHFSYGMVELPEGKMKSREGTVVDADDLMDSMEATARDASAERLSSFPKEEADEIARIIGMGALKYFLLKVDPKKNMLFNPKESIDFNGNTGPFLQYTYARINSLLEKAGEPNPGQVEGNPTLNEKETALIQLVASFPDVVKEAGASYSPALIANYAYELAKSYNQFYHDCPIMREEDGYIRSLRLLLSYVTARTLRAAASLLGMEMPRRM